MRSRDGDQTLLRRYCSLVVFLCFYSSAVADEYLISYRYFVKDATLYNEKLLVAKAMQPCSGTADKTIMLSRNKDENLEQVILKNSERFYRFLHALGVEIEHQEQLYAGMSHSATTLTLRTQCFKVDFNDSFVKISSLK